MEAVVWKEGGCGLGWLAGPYTIFFREEAVDSRVECEMIGCDGDL